MKKFKFLDNNEDSTLSRYSSTPVNQGLYTTLTISPNDDLNTINVTNTLREFCFQFNNGEPIVFADGRDPLTIRLSSNETNITFTDNNNTFKLFSRPNDTI